MAERNPATARAIKRVQETNGKPRPVDDTFVVVPVKFTRDELEALDAYVEGDTGIGRGLTREMAVKDALRDLIPGM